MKRSPKKKNSRSSELAPIPPLKAHRSKRHPRTNMIPDTSAADLEMLQDGLDEQILSVDEVIDMLGQ